MKIFKQYLIFVLLLAFMPVVAMRQGARTLSGAFKGMKPNSMPKIAKSSFGVGSSKTIGRSKGLSMKDFGKAPTLSKIKIEKMPVDSVNLIKAPKVRKKITKKPEQQTTVDTSKKIESKVEKISKKSAKTVEAKEPSLRAAEKKPRIKIPKIKSTSNKALVPVKKAAELVVHQKSVVGEVIESPVVSSTREIAKRVFFDGSVVQDGNIYLKNLLMHNAARLRACGATISRESIELLTNLLGKKEFNVMAQEVEKMAAKLMTSGTSKQAVVKAGQAVHQLSAQEQKILIQESEAIVNILKKCKQELGSVKGDISMPIQAFEREMSQVVRSLEQGTTRKAIELPALPEKPVSVKKVTIKPKALKASKQEAPIALKEIKGLKENPVKAVVDEVAIAGESKILPEAPKVGRVLKKALPDTNAIEVIQCEVGAPIRHAAKEAFVEASQSVSRAAGKVKTRVVNALSGTAKRATKVKAKESKQPSLTVKSKKAKVVKPTKAEKNAQKAQKEAADAKKAAEKIAKAEAKAAKRAAKDREALAKAEQKAARERLRQAKKEQKEELKRNKIPGQKKGETAQKHKPAAKGKELTVPHERPVVRVAPKNKELVVRPERPVVRRVPKNNKLAVPKRPTVRRGLNPQNAAKRAKYRRWARTSVGRAMRKFKTKMPRVSKALKAVGAAAAVAAGIYAGNQLLAQNDNNSLQENPMVNTGQPMASPSYPVGVGAGAHGFHNGYDSDEDASTDVEDEQIEDSIDLKEDNLHSGIDDLNSVEPLLADDDDAFGHYKALLIADDITIDGKLMKAALQKNNEKIAAALIAHDVLDLAWADDSDLLRSSIRLMNTMKERAPHSERMKKEYEHSCLRLQAFVQWATAVEKN